MRHTKRLRSLSLTAASLAVASALALGSAAAQTQDQKDYTMSLKEELAAFRDRVAALEGDSAVEDAWEEVTGDWGRLELATEAQWEEAKQEFEDSWQKFQDTMEEATN